MTTLTLQTIVNGERNVVIKGHIVGTAVELTNELFVDASALGATDLKLTRVIAELDGFSAILLWDATANVEITQLVNDQEIDQDYESFGGLINNSGAGKTGDVLITTVGAAVGTDGTVILHLKKRG